MRKFSALILIFLILFSLSACGGFSEKDLVGKWDAEFKLGEFWAFNAENSSLGENELPIDFNDIKINIRLEYYKNGTCDTFISKENWGKYLEDVVTATINHYKNGGLLDTYKEQGVNVSTLDELDVILKDINSSVEQEISKIENTLKESLENTSEDTFTDITDDGYYYMTEKPEKYSVEENVIKYINNDGDEELTYFELINKDKIKITKIRADFEEHKTSIIFNRVK